MLVSNYKSLFDILRCENYKDDYEGDYKEVIEKSDVLWNLYHYNHTVYNSIENDVQSAFSSIPDEEEAARYIDENFNKLVKNYSSECIPNKYKTNESN